MGPIDLNPGQSSRVGFTLASGPPEVQWIHPNTPTCLPPPTLTSAGQDRTALIVVVLTLACTALSLFDLVLLISGS